MGPDKYNIIMSYFPEYKRIIDILLADGDHV
jgi:hypothetical protein